MATREITVRFRPQVSEARKERLLRHLGLTTLRGNAFHLRQYVVAQPEYADGTRTLDLANRLREADNLVEYAAPKFISEHQKGALPNDPRLSRQWHLNNRGGNGALEGEDVDAFLAWNLVPGGSPDVAIAIVDDGVDIGHPDLRANIWQNPNPSAPDKNGRNFYDDDLDPRPRYFQAPFDVLEGNDIHGTPCAGVAAAVGNNRRGVAGIAYACHILPVKIFGADALAPNDRVADAIRYAGLHAAVISCSWSGPVNPDLESAISDVIQTGRGGKGCLVFCATGNGFQNQIAFPARLDQALAIGASNDQGMRSAYSNFGPGIDLVAPSSDGDRAGITTTDLSRRNRGFSLNSAYTDSFGGTSSATPLAAGVAALVFAKNPALSWVEVRAGFPTTLSLVVSRCAQTQRSPSRVANGLARCRDEGVAMSAAGTKTFHRIHVHFMKAIAVVIPRIFATAVTDAFMRIAPLFQAAVDIVFIRIHTRARGNCRLHQWLDGPLWDVCQHAHDHLSPALDHPEDRWCLRCKCPSTALALEASPPAAPPFFPTASGFPLWPATM